MSLPTESEFQSAEPIVRLDGVGVRYRVAQERIASFKEYAIRRVKGQVRYVDFWALQEVNLSIQPGEVFGIIGPNGAGKSTLLKVIARVLRPTTGRVRIRGRLAPLLELGAGFDPELTGRENIYLNGAILGYTKNQIDRLYDSIVEFSGLSEFIDAPLRTYSTGMYARLGFAVATAERPDILIVDEILGVGDAEFQVKSFERIQGFRAAGTTILLVSHSLERVEEVCSRALWLERGQAVSLGSAQAVVSQYLERNRQREAQQLSAQRQAVEQSQATSTQAPTRWGNSQIEITGVRITDERGEQKTIFETGSPLHIHIHYIAHQPVQSPLFGIAIHRQDGAHITGPNTGFHGLDLGLLQGPGVVRFEIPSLPLLENLYHVSAAVVSHDDSQTYDYHDRLYPFRVLNTSRERQERYGLVTVQGTWQHERMKHE